MIKKTLILIVLLASTICAVDSNIFLQANTSYSSVGFRHKFQPSYKHDVLLPDYFEISASPVWHYKFGAGGEAGAKIYINNSFGFYAGGFFTKKLRANLAFCGDVSRYITVNTGLLLGDDSIDFEPYIGIRLNLNGQLTSWRFD